MEIHSNRFFFSLCVFILNKFTMCLLISYVVIFLSPFLGLIKMPKHESCGPLVSPLPPRPMWKYPNSSSSSIRRTQWPPAAASLKCCCHSATSSFGADDCLCLITRRVFKMIFCVCFCLVLAELMIFSSSSLMVNGPIQFDILNRSVAQFAVNYVHNLEHIAYFLINNNIYFIFFYLLFWNFYFR